MIDYSKMSKLELASFICSKLKENDIEVVLSGGACVEIYSKGNYTSLDIDLINRYNETFRKIKIVMEDLCFTEKEKYFIHENTDIFIEFPPGPLGIGDEIATETAELKTKFGVLRLLTPTDCIKDRLAAYYHWNDKQSLDQAIWIAENTEYNLNDIKQWSIKENSLDKFEIFIQKLGK